MEAANRTISDKLSIALATCGVGFIPLAPGTWGSAVGVGIYLLWQKLLPFVFSGTRNGGVATTTSLLVNGLAFALVCAVGFWAAGRCATVMAEKDPQKVVVDEVMGQLMTFMFVPFGSSWAVIVTGFVLFRIFDIWKPYPVKKAESLPAGFGICADDLLAGVYAGAVLALLSIFFIS